MKRILTLSFLAIAIIATGSMGCGNNVCDDAENVLEACTNINVVDASDDNDVACEGVNRCEAECIINNQAGACESLEPVENQDPITIEPFNNCIAVCNGLLL